MLFRSLNIDLNKVTKKYEGLDGTELAISESQERMAVAVAAEDAEKFIALANEENLEATVVATVTEEKRMRENWNGVAIVDLSREFLNSNGAERHADVHVLPGTVWQPQWAGSTFADLGTGYGVVLFLHDLGFLLIAVFGLAHIFLGGGIFQPYRGTYKLMFGNGLVSEADALYHWGHWARKEITSGKNVVEKDAK